MAHVDVELLDVENTKITKISIAFAFTVIMGKQNCGDTSHPRYKCLIRPRNEKKCYRCYGDTLLV